MFFFHLLYHPQYTFAGLSDHLLRQVCKQRGTEIPVASKAKSLIALYREAFKQEIKPARYGLSDHRV